MMRKTHKKLVKKALSNPKVKRAYDALGEETNLLRTMVSLRYKLRKTQADIAQAMGTTTSVIGRLETSGKNQNHSPTLTTLRKYAQALGYELYLRFIPHKGH